MIELLTSDSRRERGGDGRVTGRSVFSPKLSHMRRDSDSATYADPQKPFKSAGEDYT